MPTLVSTPEDTRIYEIAVLYPHGLAQKEEQEAMKEVETLFAEAGATQVAKDAWGRRGLAYVIKGHTEGNFVIYYYEMDPARLKEIDQALRIMKNVLRHMVIKPPKGYQILKYSEVYEKWLKERETVDQVRAREREEKLKEQVAKKAKMQAQRATEKTEEARRKTEAKPRIEEEILTEKIDKLISDDTFDL